MTFEHLESTAKRHIRTYSGQKDLNVKRWREGSKSKEDMLLENTILAAKIEAIQFLFHSAQ